MTKQERTLETLKQIKSIASNYSSPDWLTIEQQRKDDGKLPSAAIRNGADWTRVHQMVKDLMKENG